MAIITDDRRYGWQGNIGCENDSSAKVVFQTLTSTATAANVETAIGNCPANQVVLLQAGNYTWNARIDWQGVNDGVALRGEQDANGNPTTFITWTAFSLAGMLMRATAVSESPLTVDADLTVDAVKGESTITLASVPSWVTVGKFIGIDQLDDDSFVSNVGTEGGESYREIMGQGPRGLGMLNRVASKTATTITFEMPLNYGYETFWDAQIFQPAYVPNTASPLKGCGIENLDITCTHSTAGTRVVMFQVADSCYLKNLRLNDSPDVPVYGDFSYRCQINKVDCRGTEQLGSGAGYSIALYNICTGFLVEDCILKAFHNNLTGNYGSNCNVFSYCYELDGTSSSGQNPGMNTHGVHTYLNLWEGNWCEDKLLGDWTHGSASHNTVFRCRITGENGTEDERCCFSIEYFNRYWNAVGNLLGTTGLQNKYLQNSSSPTEGSEGSVMKIGGEVNINNDFTPSDLDSYTSGSFFLNHGNWNSVQDQQNWEPTIADHDVPDSLYLSEKPDWFYGLSWPPFDPANPGAASLENIPAGYRYVNGTNPPESADIPLMNLTNLNATTLTVG